MKSKIIFNLKFKMTSCSRFLSFLSKYFFNMMPPDLSEVPEEHVEDVGLGAQAHGGLVHGPRQQLRVPDHHEAVLGAELPPAGVALPLGLQVGEHLRVLVGAQHHAEHLQEEEEG